MQAIPQSCAFVKGTSITSGPPYLIRGLSPDDLRLGPGLVHDYVSVSLPKRIIKKGKGQKHGEG